MQHDEKQLCIKRYVVVARGVPVTPNGSHSALVDQRREQGLLSKKAANCGFLSPRRGGWGRGKEKGRKKKERKKAREEERRHHNNRRRQTTTTTTRTAHRRKRERRKEAKKAR